MSKLFSGIILGIISVLLIGVVAGYLVITNGMIPMAGDAPSSPFEAWAAHHVLDAVLQREANELNPLSADEKNLMAGAKIYGTNCAGCHGTPINKTPSFGKGFIPPPTFFGNGDLITDDPEDHTYWKIKHGIKFTGMPAFKGMLTTKEIWQVTAFLKHMDDLPTKVSSYWNTMK